MVTPQEIELKEFSRSVRGYDRDEVDEFLDLIILHIFVIYCYYEQKIEIL